jgi:hypothetical protein
MRISSNTTGSSRSNVTHHSMYDYLPQEFDSLHRHRYSICLEPEDKYHCKAHSYMDFDTGQSNDSIINIKVSIKWHGVKEKCHLYRPFKYQKLKMIRYKLI